MGLRGPGAKPLKSAKTVAASIKRFPWNKPKLPLWQRVVIFCEWLPITQGKFAGSNIVLRPWQVDFIKSVFWQDTDGSRPVRTAVLTLARKNGKTLLAATLALCALVGPTSEERGEVYSCANDTAQAAKIFAEITAMLAKRPALGGLCNPIKFNKTIEVLQGPSEGSIFKALSSDAATKLGLNTSFCVYDELGSAPNRTLYDTMDSSMSGRENPLLMVISTQAASDLAIMSELVDYGIRVNSGDIEDSSFHLTMFAAPDDADPFIEATWHLANPALGDFKSLEDTRRQALQAKRVASKESAFRNLILNQRVAAETRFVHRSEWQACGGEIDIERLKGKPCFGGLDLSFTRDLSALVLAFPDDSGGFDLLCRFWLPADGIEAKAETDRTPWPLWAKQGHLTLTPGKIVDPGFIARELDTLSKTFDIRAIAFDRFRIQDVKRAADEIRADLPFVEFGQGFVSFGPVVDCLERLIAEGKLRHGNNPILTMCSSNAVIVRDPAGNRKLDKSKSIGRIDGLIAAGMALRTAETHIPEIMPAWMRLLLKEPAG